jgi:hypothetical protein
MDSSNFDHALAGAGNVRSGGSEPRPRLAGWLLLLAGVGCLGALASFAGSCGNAGAVQPRTPSSDCAAQAPYDLSVIEHYNSTTSVAWFSYGDLTPGATHTGQDGGAIYPVDIEDGGHCGATGALLLQSQGHNDYGSGFGTYDLGAGQPIIDYLNGIQSGNRMNPLSYDPRVNAPDGGCILPDGSFVNCSIDAGAFEGVAFWARSFDPTGGLTTNTVNVALADKDTAYGIGSTCILCCGTNGIEGGVLTTTSGIGTVTTVSGFAGGGAIWYPIGCPTSEAGPDYFAEAGPGVISVLAPPYCCGNNFTYYSLQTTDQWAFYTLPWSSFHQLAQPTRRAEGFDPQTVFQFLVTVPKEAHLSLWIHDIAFYRARQGDAEAGP